MRQHQELTAELSEFITLYALDSLGSEDSREFASHVDVCPVCRHELQALQSTLGVLGYAAPVAAPPGELKARVLARVPATVMPAQPPRTILDVLRMSDVVWEPSEYPGISFHWLRHEVATGTAAALVKIQPGCRYAAHRHRGGEDCLVLQGGFRDRRGEYHAGDFVYYEPDSIHYDFQALEDAECILFIIAHGGLEILSTP